MATALFFRPDWEEDLAMRYVAYWTKLGVDYAVQRGYNVVDLYGNAATKERLKSAIDQFQPEILILAGHGSNTILTGQHLQVVLEACVNDEWVSDAISHFVSCSVGQELLPSLITKGGIWTIGYQVDYVFMVSYPYDPVTDPLAEPFKDITVAIIQKILDGGTLKETWDAGIAKCNEWIAKLWNRRGLEWAEAIDAVQHDRDGLIGLATDAEFRVQPTTVNAVPILLLIFLFLATRG